ncbi:choloylglycine hydrolase family protein [Chitinophaga sp. G-6-1-13]|uniref:Choloylglycine hydrolase family protein n=1 Tax=Chitinophaga fulva TaxID=2728842 RepID=A0A848GR58_9BACT|nr:choloylglycine hydrolase family protein [Chitinophaga fulva]NML41105.1 choloylglycine hydrolase family protein [Chitinophaga fulva]
MKTGLFKTLCYALGISLLASPITVPACTGIQLRARDGAIICARTLEFYNDLQAQVVVYPRNYPFNAVSPGGANKGLYWKARYAIVGINSMGKDAIADGMNEKGLAVGLYYLPGYASYMNVPPKKIAKSLSSTDVSAWLLSNFATVDQVKKAVDSGILINKGIPLYVNGGIPFPLHYSVHDADGKSLVIECVNGKLHCYYNPLGVLTNSPTFDWHIANLQQYLNSRPSDACLKVGEDSIRSFGPGNGLVGIPGDFTPSSRFVRAVAYTQSLDPSPTADEAVTQAFQILNAFDIPKGVIKDRTHPGNNVYTLWTCANDLKNKRLYFHTINNRTLHMIDLMKYVNTDKVLFFPMDDPMEVVQN